MASFTGSYGGRLELRDRLVYNMAKVGVGMESFVIIALIFLWLASAGFCAWLGHVKDDDGISWSILGLLFGIIALIAIAGAPAKPKRWERQCPECDESISVKALVCHWCGARQCDPQSPLPPPDIDAPYAEEPSAANTEDQTADDGKKELKFIVVSIVVISAIAAIIWVVSVAVD